MKALVTRPREDSGELAAALAARGIEPVIEPLLTIRFAEDGAGVLAPLLAGVQAVLFTSANGVRAFAAASAHRDLPAFAVGDATAQAARDAGFAAVASAGGDAQALAALVRQRLKPEDGALIHAAQRESAGDLAGALAAAGFELRPALLYEALPAERLSGETASMLTAGEVTLALFFSPRTAGLFVRLASAAGIERACRTMAAVVLSPAVAAALEPLAWRAVHVAEAPTLAALLAATDRAVAEGKGPHVSGGDSMTDERTAETVPPDPAASRPKRRLGAGPWLLSAMLVALVIVGAVPYWAPPLLPLLPWGRSEAAPPQFADLQARVNAAEAALTRLEAQARQQQPAAPAQPDAAALQALGQRIDALEHSAQPNHAADEIQPLKDSLQQTSARLDADEARLGRIAATQTASDTGDVKLLAALANLRAALAGSAPYQDELASVAALGQGDPKIAEALKPLAADAAAGLPDIALLTERFRTETAPAIRRAASKAASDEGTLGERALARIEGLVTIRRVGDDDAAKDDPVERARAALGNGDLAAAVAALKTLGGAPAEAARPWIEIAERRIAADAAVAGLARQAGGRLAAPAAPGENR